MAEQAQALALSAGWTTAEAIMTNASPTVANYMAALPNAAAGNYNNFTIYPNNFNGWWWQGYWYPYYIPVPVGETPRPIKLTMAEVERLRVAARRDKELRLTLEKFTPLIEVQVDFSEKK